MDSARVADDLLAQLRAQGDAARAEHDVRYLKSQREHWGVSVPAVRRIAASAGRSIGHGDLIELTSRLWAAGPYDASLCSAILLERHARVLGPADLAVVEQRLREAGTWALVDVLAPRPLAAIDAADPAATTRVLDKWVGDCDFWLRRAALLAHLMPLRSGLTRWPRFSRYADALLSDREFFVRKAIGWVLRETARHDPDLVADWVGGRITVISGVALREAVRPMPAGRREELLEAYRAAQPRRAAVRTTLSR